MEAGGNWTLIPGLELETSRAPVGVREQVSLTGRDTTINQENWCTSQQASYRLCLQFLLQRIRLKPKCSQFVRFYTLPWLHVHWGDCYCSRFLSSEQWAECSTTVRQTSAPAPPFSWSGDKAHTPPLAGQISVNVCHRSAGKKHAK